MASTAGLEYIQRLSRTELLSRLQLLPVVDPIAEDAYEVMLEKSFRTSDEGHGEPWHISFHASSFPGDTSRACGRAAMYQLMNIPAKHFSRVASATMAEGKAIEEDLVMAFHVAGVLLSPAPFERQLNFEDHECWLSGHIDAVILIDNHPTPIEIKSVFQQVIDEMRAGIRGPYDDHVAQLKPYIDFVRKHQDDLWPGLDRCDHGYIYYLSRDRPSNFADKTLNTAEFLVGHDLNFIEAGKERLREWKQYFLSNELPETHHFNGKKRGHPFGWKWTLGPCQNGSSPCPYKKNCCKPDWEQGILDIRQSNAIQYAREVRGEYSYEDARELVLNRWS